MRLPLPLTPVRGSWLLVLLLSASATAAPPTVTHLFPPGAQRGTTAAVTAGGTFDTWPVKVWVDSPGVAVEPAKDRGKFTVTVAADAVPGVCRLRFHAPDGASGIRHFAIGTLPDVAEKEPNDEPKTAQSILGPVVVNGQLVKAGDVDCYAVPLKKGQTLVAAVEANRGLKSPMDAVLEVVSLDGFVLADNHDANGLDPQLAFAAPKDGTYVVRVFAFPAAPDTTIRFAGGEAYVYRLTLTAGGFADFPVPLAVAKPDGAVALEGWNLPTDLKPAVSPPRPGDPFRTLFHPTLANAVRVRVEPHPTFAAPPAAPPAAPVSFTGRVPERGYSDFAFTGKKGVPLAVEVESRTLGLAVNPAVRVLDSAGKEVARGEPPSANGDTALSLTPAADGVYTARVADLYAGGGKRFAYLLRVTPAVPDFALTATADRFAVAPEKSVDIAIKVARKHGFAKPVEVVAEGLPADAKLEVKPAKPDAKPDPNALTLTLTAGKAPFSGPLRLVGTAATPRPVTAPLAAESPDSTADLWLTVTEPAKK